MPGPVQPYLFFEGRCEEALAFYEKALGAERGQLMRYSDNPDPSRADCPTPPGDKVMHCNFTVGGTQIMASDGMASGTTNFKGFGLTLGADTTQEAERMFQALADGGKIQMPLGKTFYSPAFGMVEDRFGVLWMVMVSP
ncbi:MAG: VOC family protein [Simplicispira suum]|uniref:VOC family protein n=1 Tax=Simplicispira suum TaxID=2109915 RepID=UPI001C6D0200|nr:VOC family protein [Simplicispira suum]MBW7832430.1 VOC family protein [Simplicispira suum]